MEKLHKLVTALENSISKREIINTTISKSNVGWHIEHILLSINGVVESIKDSNPSNYKWSFNISKIIIFTINKIPRGRGKSPKIVTPKTYDEETLKKHIETTRLKLEELSSTNKSKYYNHPFFWHLKVNGTIKFLKIHTNHHLKIINDILESNK